MPAPVLALVFSLMLAARPTVAVEVAADLPADATMDPTVDSTTGSTPPGTAAATPVATDDVAMRQRRAWLVRRLLEEGYDVAAHEAGAHGVVRLRASDDGLVVEVEGRARRSYAIEPGPEAVVRLEALHRALLGVEQALDPTRAIATPEPGLTLRFVVASSEDAPLLEAVATAAHVRGVTLSSQPAPDDTLACVDRRGSLAQIGVGPAAEGCGPPLLVLELGDGSQVAIQRAADDLLAVTSTPPPEAMPLDVRALGGPPPAEMGAAPSAEPTDADAELVAMHGPPRAEARVGVSAGVVSRGRWVDPLVQAGWRMGKIRGIGARLSTSLVPSSARRLGDSLRVLDARLVVGPDWELAAGRRGHVAVAALVGTDLHVSGVGDETAGDVAFAAEIPVTYALSLRGHTRLDFIVDPGITSVAWSHRSALWRTGEIMWERPVWRVGVALGITHGWRIE